MQKFKIAYYLFIVLFLLCAASVYGQETGKKLSGTPIGSISVDYSTSPVSPSTTVTIQSSRGTPFFVTSGAIDGIEQMVWAMGAGSQIPLASITM